jgi:hypothetical protein
MFRDCNGYDFTDVERYWLQDDKGNVVQEGKSFDLKYVRAMVELILEEV